MFKKLLIILFIFTLIPFYRVNAQELSIGVAKYVTIEEENVENGDVISLVDGKYVRSAKAYDPNIVGIVSLNPAISIEPNISDGMYPIIDKGDTEVRVSSSNGVIAEGDLLTTSENPGVAIKAGNTGFIVGVARQDYTVENPDEVGVINVSLQPSFNYGNSEEKLKTSFADIFSLSTIAAYQNPSQVIQHLVAGIVLLLSIILGFFTFARVAAEGVEAVGRNPSAKTSIGLGIIVNVTITVVIILGGVFVSYLILSI